MLNNLFKYASLLLAAAMLLSCSGAGGDDSGSVAAKQLVIKADKQFVQTFGDDYITLTVSLGDEIITDGVTFYDEKNNVIEIEDFKFKPQDPGEYNIRAGYLTYFTKEVLTVTALAVEIPESPADPDPSRTDFESKVLVMQFTTTGCVYCPQMKTVLKNVMATYSDKVVKVDCHNGTINEAYTNKPHDDPAYVHLPKYNISTYPYVMLDYYAGGGNTEDKIKSQIDAMLNYKEGKSAGIAVSSKLKDGQIVAKVVVKAAVTGSYRVGLMLLEDNIVAGNNQLQLGEGVEDWMNVHNSCIRYLDADVNYYGHSLGEMVVEENGSVKHVINAGDTCEYVFVLNLPAIWRDGISKADAAQCTWSSKWVEEELHLGVFVTETPENNTKAYVSNVIDCPVDGVTPFEYK